MVRPQRAWPISATDTHTQPISSVERWTSSSRTVTSDHFLLRWEASAIRPTPNSATVQPRQWSRLDMENFRSAVSTSRLCQPDTWPTDIDEMAMQYDDELNRLLDRLLPLRQFVRKQRPSDPYFDKECRDAKRLSRQLERAYAAACRCDSC